VSASAELCSLQGRIRLARRTRAVQCAAALPETAAALMEHLAGHAVAALVMAFACFCFTVNVALQTATIRRLRRQEAGLVLREAGPRPYLASPPAPAAAAGVTMAEFCGGMARLAAALGPCAHPDAVPVDLLVTGERVAWVCPGCGSDLPAAWRPGGEP
jgi:hypothetical protein